MNRQDANIGTDTVGAKNSNDYGSSHFIPCRKMHYVLDITPYVAVPSRRLQAIGVSNARH
jgi:hypothetical protein